MAQIFQEGSNDVVRAVIVGVPLLVLSLVGALYAVEWSPWASITGTMADARLACAAGGIAPLARELARLVAGEIKEPVPGPNARWLAAAARDLAASRGAGLVVAGEGQPGVVHDLAAAMNDALGNVGQTVFYRPCAEAQPVRQGESIRALAEDLHGGAVDLFIVLGANPVYNAPVELDFAGAMGKARRCVQMGLFYDETARYCQWHTLAGKTWTTRSITTNRCPACTAKTRRARWSARWRRPSTVRKG